MTDKSVCVRCGSERVEHEPFEIDIDDDTKMTQEFVCLDCEQWNVDIYSIKYKETVLD